MRSFLIKNILATAAIGLCLYLVPFAANAKSNSIEDLRALVKTESWKELLRTVTDVPTAKRDKEWNEIVEKMAVALITAEGSADRRASLSRELIAEYPHLKNSSAVANAGPKNNLADIEKCFGQKYNAEFCFEDLKKVVSADKKNKELPIEAAHLTVRNMTHWVAIEFYQEAIKRGAQQKACTHSRISDAIISGLKLPEGEDRVSAQKLSEECWAQQKDALVGEMAKESPDSYYWQSFCPIALKKKALSGLKEKSCQKHLKSGSKKQ